jgi:hypothetical protein
MKSRRIAAAVVLAVGLAEVEGGDSITPSGEIAAATGFSPARISSRVAAAPTSRRGRPELINMRVPAWPSRAPQGCSYGQRETRRRLVLFDIERGTRSDRRAGCSRPVCPVQRGGLQRRHPRAGG